MSLKNQRISKNVGDTEVIGIIISDEPDELNKVLVHWGIADKHKYQTMENVDDLQHIPAVPLPTFGGVGWDESFQPHI